MADTKEHKKKSNNGFVTILFILMFILTGVVLYLWMQNYQTLQDTKKELEDALAMQSTAMNSISTNFQQGRAKLQEEENEHLHTKAMLAQSQELLNAAKVESKSLAERIAMLESKNTEQEAKNKGLDQQNRELAKTIGLLKAKNEAVENEILELQAKLAEYNTDVATIADGKTMIRFFKNKINEVKSSVHGIRQKTQLAKETAQREIDHLEYMAGNKGYLKKDFVWAPPTPKPVSKADVNINVKFIQ